MARKYNRFLQHAVATKLGKLYGRGGDFDDPLTETDHARAAAALDGLFDYLESAAKEHRMPRAEAYSYQSFLTAAQDEPAGVPLSKSEI